MTIAVTYPSGKAHVVDKRNDVGHCQVQHGEQCHRQHGWCGRETLNLNHGKNFRHLSLIGAGIEETRGGEQDAIDSTKSGQGNKH